MTAPDLSARLLAAITEVERNEHANIPFGHPPLLLSLCQAHREIVEEWLKESTDWRDGLTDDDLHQHRTHPAYEYATTEGQRKAWDYVDDPPAGDGWELNITSVDHDAWERFDYTEERYWRRLRPGGPEQWTRHVPRHIEILARAYGLNPEENTA